MQQSNNQQNPHKNITKTALHAVAVPKPSLRPAGETLLLTVEGRYDATKDPQIGGNARADIAVVYYNIVFIY